MSSKQKEVKLNEKLNEKLNKNLKKLTAQYEKFLKSFTEKCKKEFTNSCKEIFDTYPNLETFSWQQYTPYFNDGEECSFSVYADYPYMNGEDLDEIEDNENHSKEYVEEMQNASNTIVGFIQSFDEDMLKIMFGDHVEVLISKDKVEISHYEHE